MSTLDDWITEVAGELGITELGDLVDPAFARPLVLDLTRDVAHAVARPAAPVTAYLLGLAVARSAGSGPASSEVASALAERLATIARGRTDADGTEGVTGGDEPPGEEAGTDRDPVVGSG